MVLVEVGPRTLRAVRGQAFNTGSRPQDATCGPGLCCSMSNDACGRPDVVSSPEALSVSERPAPSGTVSCSGELCLWPAAAVGPVFLPQAMWQLSAGLRERDLSQDTLYGSDGKTLGNALNSKR